VNLFQFVFVSFAPRYRAPFTANSGSEYSAAKFANIQAGYAQGSDSIEISKREPYVDEASGKEGLYTQRKYNAGKYPFFTLSLLLRSSYFFTSFCFEFVNCCPVQEPL
jgi:hypothetical protein